MKRLIPASSAALLLSLVLGCGTSPTGPGSARLSQVSQQTADDLALQTITSMTVVGGDLQVALGSTPAAPALRARQLAHARALWDTSFAVDGITYQATRIYFDALGNELIGYGPDAARMRWTGRAYGNFQGPRDTASVGHDALIDVRGIEASQDIERLDGTCHDTLQTAFRAMDSMFTHYFFWTSTTAIDAVRMLKSTLSSGGWPISGTVTCRVSADRLRSNNRADIEAHFDATVVVIYDGTSQPDIVVDGIYRYRWDMLTGQITRV